MTNLNDYRVLCRKGARELTPLEVDSIRGSGGGINTTACTAPSVITATGTGPDGDICGHGHDTDSDF